MIMDFKRLGFKGERERDLQYFTHYFPHRMLLLTHIHIHKKVTAAITVSHNVHLMQAQEP